MSRWVRVSADIFEHEFFSRSEMSEREAWLWLITKAAWKDTRHRIGGEMHTCERGSLFTTLRALADAWGWKSDKRVRLFLEALERENMIARKMDAGKTQIFINNYDTYQSSGRTEDASGTQAGRKQDALKIPEYQDTNTTLLTREPVSAPSRAELDSLETDCRKAANAEQNPSPGLIDLSPIMSALRDGADLHADILPVIRQITARGHRWRSWAYALQAIADARDRRLRGLPPPSPVTTTAFGHRNNGNNRQNSTVDAFLAIAREFSEPETVSEISGDRPRMLGS